MKKRLIITGDDGYNSPGIRALARLLKDEWEVTIAATRNQQTAVGGAMSLNSGFAWERTEFEGVETYIVDGTPVDAVELATSYLEEPYDLLLSGINLGSNIGPGVFTSGTVSAALRGMGTSLAPKAIAFSWEAPAEMYTKKTR